MRASAKHLAVGGRHVQIVKHGRHHPAGTFRPVAAAIAGNGNAAIVSRNDDVVLRPQQSVMVCVYVILHAARGAGNPAPVASRIAGAVEVHAAPNHAFRLARMNNDGVVVRHLAFAGVAPAQDFPPGVAPVGAAKEAQHVVGAVRGEGVDHIRVGRREGQTDSPELVAGRKSFGQVIPVFSEIPAAPDSVERTVRLNRRENRAAVARVEQHRVAIVAALSPEYARSQSGPLIPGIPQIQSGGKAVVQKHAADGEPVILESHAADAARERPDILIDGIRHAHRRPEERLPGKALVLRVVHSATGVRIPEHVGFPGGGEQARLARKVGLEWAAEAETS